MMWWWWLGGWLLVVLKEVRKVVAFVSLMMMMLSLAAHVKTRKNTLSHTTNCACPSNNLVAVENKGSVG